MRSPSIPNEIKQRIIEAHKKHPDWTAQTIIQHHGFAISRSYCRNIMLYGTRPKGSVCVPRHQYKDPPRKPSIYCNFNCPTCGMGYDKMRDAEECCK